MVDDITPQPSPPVDPAHHVDPGHLLPDADWAAVLVRAREIRDQVRADAGGGAASGIAPVLDLTGAGIASGKYFPVSGIPTQLLVLHSAECPLQGGFARSLTEWFQSTKYPAAPIASWQRFVDPLHRVRALPDELGAWHASEANVLSIGWEQAGYARFSRAEWLTPDGQAQLESLAFDMAEVAVRDGIPARWLTYDEVRAVLDGGNRTIKGFCVHRQVDPETRTDPGDGYPYDLLMQRIEFYMTGGTPAAETITTEQEDDMLYLAAPGDNRIWLSNGLQKWHVPDPAHLIHIRTIGSWGAISLYAEGKVLEAPALGVDMGAYAVPQGVNVEVGADDVAAIAEALKVSLAPELAADLSRRLAE